MHPKGTPLHCSNCIPAAEVEHDNSQQDVASYAAEQLVRAPTTSPRPLQLATGGFHNDGGVTGFFHRWNLLVEAGLTVLLELVVVCGLPAIVLARHRLVSTTDVMAQLQLVAKQ